MRLSAYIAVALTAAVWSAALALLSAPSPAPSQSAGAYIPRNAREQFAVDLLAALGNDQPTVETIAFVVAWQDGEGTMAQFNPLATTQSWPGDSCFNYLSRQCGVRNYATYDEGLHATVRTITNGFYPHILNGLQTNNPDEALNDAELGIWGTGAGNVRALWR